MSGHGDFREKLRAFGLRSRGEYECEEGRETAEYVLTKCKVRNQESKIMMDKIGVRNTVEWRRGTYDKLLTEGVYALVDFVRVVIMRK